MNTHIFIGAQPLAQPALDLQSIIPEHFITPLSLIVTTQREQNLTKFQWKPQNYGMCIVGIGATLLGSYFIPFRQIRAFVILRIQLILGKYQISKIECFVFQPVTF